MSLEQRPLARIGSLAVRGPGAVLACAVAVTAVELGFATHKTPGLTVEPLAPLALHAIALAPLALALFPPAALAIVLERRHWVLAAGLPALACALMAYYPLRWLARDLASGDWIKQQPIAPAIRLWTPVACSLAIGGVSAAVALLARRGRGRFAIPIAGLALSVIALCADELVLVGLYPVAHQALYVVAGLAALVCAAAWIRDRTLGWTGKGLLVVAPTLVLGAAIGAPWPFDPAARAMVTTVAPTVGSLLLPRLPKARTTFLRRNLERLGEAPAPAPHPALVVPPAQSAIVIIVDTLRGDALPAARTGNEPFIRPGETPFLDRYFAESFRFRRAYSQGTATARAVPALHRGVEPWEGITEFAPTLPELAREHGLTSIAVVPPYFVEPNDPHAQRLSQGFDRLATYPVASQELLVDELREALADLGDQRFLAWVHFYCVHQPGSYDGRLLTARDGSRVSRYRRSLRWLDGQMKRLVDLLGELGLSDHTVVVFAADHGENLGEGARFGHGSGVSEAEIRVPLAFHVPGVPGRVVDGLVSNIDVMPTVLALLGLPPHPTHRGQSLLPRFAGAPGSPSVYIESPRAFMSGVIVGNKKLVYVPSQGAYSLFDLETDPFGLKNLISREPQAFAELAGVMARHSPSLYAPELRDAATFELLRARLREAGDRSPPADLLFLMRLAALTNEPGIADDLESLFRRSTLPGLRLDVLTVLAALDGRRTARLLGDALATIRGTSEETALVAGLADRGQKRFGDTFAVQRLKDLVGATPELQRAWLRLTRRWTKPAAAYLEPLVALLPPRTDPDPLDLAPLVLENLATLDRLERGATERLASQTLSDGTPLARHVARYLDHPDRRVGTMAARALGTLGGSTASQELRSLIAGQAVHAQVQQAGLRALVAIEKRAALDLLLGVDPRSLLADEVVPLAIELQASELVPLLTRIARVNPSSFARAAATKAIRTIKLGAKKAKAKKGPGRKT